MQTEYMNFEGESVSDIYIQEPPKYSTVACCLCWTVQASWRPDIGKELQGDNLTTVIPSPNRWTSTKTLVSLTTDNHSLR